ncbi:tRNA pseudouridine synthase B [Actinomyces bovis]|uniref:tRNA pseudouridine synthase B n=1 Tax=Actinomyces bovis TaxID=1658 RepID=A0ABY1VKJ2_9ACTO|nr:tRNA pseudouridine(55) synthase TruB [Actinomyces bovis]SPT52620.1 tRNA pseudouridine synthase B [Actinomyces bovis]VEG54480.1 tRNA pseudouridine synthase B [Actinomyces israelii]
MNPTRPRTPRGVATAPDGLLLVDKAAGMTSHDVVGAARALAATRKVGHAGTLDPLATGLLVLGIGKATRFLTYLVGADKTYTATVRLGQETLTEDAAGEITATQGCPPPPQWSAPGFSNRLDTALAALSGQIMQVPSAVSAIKVDGVRSYKRVREGEAVALPARPVTIHALELLAPPRPATAGDGTAVVDLDLQVACSSGTYVRALARDLGQALGTGAHLTALRRTQVGPFSLAEARSLDQLSQEVTSCAKAAEAGGEAKPLRTLPLVEVARRCFSSLELSDSDARALGFGQSLPGAVIQRVNWLDEAITSKAAVCAEASDAADADSTVDSRSSQVVAGFAPEGQLVALLARKGSALRPVLVLEPAGPTTNKQKS